MSDSRSYSEDALIEQPAIQEFERLGYQSVNCFHERFGVDGTLGRETSAEVVLTRRLRWSLGILNPGMPEHVREFAVEELGRDRSALSPVRANREVYDLLKDGVKVTYQDDDDGEVVDTVRVIDWNRPEQNDFLLASQLWVSGDIYNRRADLVVFVNGLPLVLVELKAAHTRLADAYDNNLRDYKSTIPQLFWYNAFIILSNGEESRAGTITAGWEHFFEWKKIGSEEEPGIISLDTIIRGMCQRGRLLDLVENFTLFNEATGGLVKLLAKNHQYLGVNNAIDALRKLGTNRGRLGVFWHTQGSGKSYSMRFFSQAVLRKLPGNWTFLVVTDRQELDDQIYQTFQNTGAVTEEQMQADTGDHLQQLLREDHRLLFTLIQKFHTDKGTAYPMLSDRSDIIVMADEAHRSQYDTFALNMRSALPNAAFIGFTGTPLMTDDQMTRQVFGDYVSIYNFKQSVDDGATVPLYYENRIPELQLAAGDLNAEIEAVIDVAGLDDMQEKRLEREFSRQYHLITRDDRLEKIAEDLVRHFMGRGETGKAMVVSIDKATTVKMFNKVQQHWMRYRDELAARAAAAPDEERQALQTKLQFMDSTDMAVVVSSAQNEAEEFQKKGLDITAHRKRIVTEDLEQKFKDPADPLRMVFVCAMWMTGFDVPSLSTIYLDKPMRNHTLMQTIARANRVFGDKLNGLIVDYVGVFRDLEKALAIYGSTPAGGTAGDTPIHSKEELVEALRIADDATEELCARCDVDIQQIIDAAGFERVKLISDAYEAIVAQEDTKKEFLALAAGVVKLYKAMLPDIAAKEFAARAVLYAVIASKIRTNSPKADINAVMGGVELVLDSFIAAQGYIIAGAADAANDGRIVDLSQVDFEELRQRFEQNRKHTETERLGQHRRSFPEARGLRKGAEPGGAARSSREPHRRRTSCL